MRASRIGFLAVAALVPLLTSCATMEAERSSSSSDGGPYQLNVPGGLLRSQLAAPTLNSKDVSSVAASSGSEWEWGAGVHVAPGFRTSMTGLTVHPFASYAYLSFDGGHDDRFEFGGQVRKAIRDAAGSPWIGAQAVAGVFRTHIDNIDDTENTNGWGVTALGGIPVGESRWGASIFGGAGYSYYGGSGWHFRAGLDLQPWFMKR